jgi:murein DD-endopeptidase MepM/ murein hydrolase activator NlpD
MTTCAQHLQEEAMQQSKKRGWLYSLVMFSVVCAAALAHTSARAAMIYIAADTVLKINTGQSSGLADNQKCAVTKGTAIDVSSVVDGGAAHWKITLPRNYYNCALTLAYVYQPHVALANFAVTVHTPTVFKKTTASASSLPASSKCDIPAGVYPSSTAVTTSASHFFINMTAIAPGCGFSQGYVFNGHTNAGITVMSTADSTWLKKSTANSTTLPAADKCLIAKGNYILTTVPTTSGSHYNVSINANPAGCAFKAGYVYYELTYLSTPAGAGGGGTISYVTPMPNGIAYSGDFSWCVCRDIGTSPHIGQDWNASGVEQSRAVADGTFVDKTFVSGCGHYLLLEDTSGARWRYLHLNANNWQIGDTITKGTIIGTHGDYPIVGQCGSGPHLHLERRSAGGFNDNEVFKTCQFGTKSCNYNPNTPFPGAGTVAAKIMQLSSTPVSETLANQFVVAVPAQSAGACRFDPASYASVNNKALADFRSGGKLRIAHDTAQNGRYTTLSLAASIDGNTNNECGRGKNCLVSWQVLAETNSGLKRLFFDASLRHRKATVVNAEQLCLPADATGRLHVLTRDFQGNQTRNVIDLE